MSTEYFEEELSRVKDTFTNLIALRTQDVPLVPGDPGSTITEPTEQEYEIAILGFQSIIELHQPQHEQISEALREYRAIIDEWKKNISKMHGVDKTTEQSSFTTVCRNLGLSTSFNQAQGKMREIGDALADARSSKRKAEIKLRAMVAAAPATAPAPVTYQFKIPQLDIDPFDGDIIQFYPFWQAFNTFIDKAHGLTPAQKFAYLLTKLKGEPKTHLLTYQQVDASYQLARDYLEGKFGKKEVIELSLRQKLTQLPRCNTKQDVRNMYQKGRCLPTTT